MKRTDLSYRLFYKIWDKCFILNDLYKMASFTPNGLILTALLILTKGCIGIRISEGSVEHYLDANL